MNVCRGVLPNTDASEPESLAALLGGWRAGVEASVPPLLFAVGWLLTGHSVWGGVIIAIASAILVAAWRLRRGHRPRAVLFGLFAVCVAALVVLYTGRAADFYLVQLVGNAAATLVWVISIVIRWPLLGVVVGLVRGQRARWRADPVLLRAYTRGSWAWVPQYLVRVVVLLPLYQADRVLELAVARVALSWPLVAVFLAFSWMVVRRSLPPGHPGLRLTRKAEAGELVTCPRP
ncbi:MAG: DUF3159 domain-containing protein [Dactylosporangium sp.]|nr:DUF3159 domain-containing protein [Dactylosporangium sp.]NNJ60486.1 DUF3159 domain-containing protein [Dactylosporangium sp.]